MASMNKIYREGQYRPYAGDELLVVRFYMDEEKDVKATEEQGKSVYRPIEMVEIHAPGDKQLSVVAPAKSTVTMGDGSQPTYIERFPEDYDRWKEGKAASVNGTPIKDAPFLDKPDLRTLESNNVFTLEQLADLGGTPLRNLGQSGRRWQQQAVQYLRGAKEDDAKDERLDQLTAQNKALRERLEALEGKKKADVTGDAKDADANNAVAKESASEVDEDEQKSDLKDKIEALTGARPRGNPSVATLESQLKEAQKK